MIPLEIVKEIKLCEISPTQRSPKYFIVALSDEENLNICREGCIAGFPETANGQWAYLDIYEGDYISFYFNGRIWDLYKVVEKFIPNKYKKNIAKGNSDRDPVPVFNEKRWNPVGNKEKIYFPFRMKLQRLKESDFETSMVFKSGLERLGINLIPRVSIKKTHFQLPLNSITTYWGLQDIDAQKRNFSLNSFIECSNRSQNRKSHSNSEEVIETLVPHELTISTCTHLEIYLQAFYKIIFEAFWFEINPVNEFENRDMEYFSEQTVYGGEADLAIVPIDNRPPEFFIELKNKTIFSKNKLTTDGQKAFEQAVHYSSVFWGKDGTKIAIAGKQRNFSKALSIATLGNNFWFFQIDESIKIKELFSEKYTKVKLRKKV